MLVKLDEISGALTSICCKKPVTLRPEFMIRVCPDGAILPMKRICDDGRFFITLDVDFADIRRYKPGSHPGILLLRPRSRSGATVLYVLRES